MTFTSPRRPSWPPPRVKLKDLRSSSCAIILLLENPVINLTYLGCVLRECLLEDFNRRHAQRKSDVSQRYRRSRQHGTRPIQKQPHPVIKRSQKSVSLE